MTNRKKDEAGPSKGILLQGPEQTKRAPSGTPKAPEGGAKKPEAPQESPEVARARREAERNARQQRASGQAEMLRTGVIPSMMHEALGFRNTFEPLGYQVFLERLLDDAGNPKDPVERMLYEQLAMAHFRIAQLHVDAAGAKGMEAVKIYNSLAARLLGEFRRTALAIRVCRGHMPTDKADPKLKIYKMAQ